MSVFLALVGGAVACLAVIVSARYLDAVAWRRSLVSYRLGLPGGLTADEVAEWLAGVAALTHAPRGALVAWPPLVLQVVASRAGIEHWLSVPKPLEGAVLSSLRAALPGVRLEAATAPVLGNPADGSSLSFEAAALRLAGRQRQLATERAESASRALLAGLQPLSGEECIRWQWIITGAGTPSPLAAPKPSTGSKGSSRSSAVPAWLLDEQLPDGEALRSARLKLREPMLHASGRIVVTADSRPRVLSLFGRAWGPIRLLNLPGARLVRALRPSWLVHRHLRSPRLPLLIWPLRLNTKELAGLLAFPLGDRVLPGVAAGAARQLPPVAGMTRSGTVLADSTYPGSHQALAISRADRLMHVWLGGPTGVGKSTLLASMALQDIARGDGLAVIDAKGDVVTDILARLPESRWSDVVVIDAADSAMPVGCNILGGSGSEAARELAVDHVLHIFKQQWADYWGPRTESVLRNALLTLTATRARDGSAFTLCEVPELLTNPSFRRTVTGQAALPASVRRFWQHYEAMSEAERRQVIGPVMNKLSAFTTRSSLRLLLGQSHGLDLSAAIRQRKIILVPLSRGLLGAETAGLIGSLLVTGIWQAALSRAGLPAGQRRPWWLYIDEAQEVVRLPLDMADMLAVGRGLGVGVTLANQHLSQLPEAVRRAVLSTVRSQVVFQVEPDDARVLARAFEPSLSERDLRSLPAYEVAMRLCSNGQTTRPVTGKTRPLVSATTDVQMLRELSRQHYGQPRADVEAAMALRLDGQAESNEGFGKRDLGSEVSR